MYAVLKDFLPLAAAFAAFIAAFIAYRSAQRAVRIQAAVTGRQAQLALMSQENLNLKQEHAITNMIWGEINNALWAVRRLAIFIEAFQQASPLNEDGSTHLINNTSLNYWSNVYYSPSISKVSRLSALTWKEVSLLEASRQNSIQVVLLQVQICDSNFREFKRRGDTNKFVYASEVKGFIETLKNTETIFKEESENCLNNRLAISKQWLVLDAKIRTFKVETSVPEDQWIRWLEQDFKGLPSRPSP